MLRKWNLYSESYIKQESPLCSLCNKKAIGDLYDRDWKQIKLCQECYGVLDKRVQACKRYCASGK